MYQRHRTTRNELNVRVCSERDSAAWAASASQCCGCRLPTGWANRNVQNVRGRRTKNPAVTAIPVGLHLPSANAVKPNLVRVQGDAESRSRSGTNGSAMTGRHERRNRRRQTQFCVHRAASEVVFPQSLSARAAGTGTAHIDSQQPERARTSNTTRKIINDDRVDRSISD